VEKLVVLVMLEACADVVQTPRIQASTKKTLPAPTSRRAKAAVFRLGDFTT
jgi:hypothetical protein